MSAGDESSDRKPLKLSDLVRAAHSDVPSIPRNALALDGIKATGDALKEAGIGRNALKQAAIEVGSTNGLAAMLAETDLTGIKNALAAASGTEAASRTLADALKTIPDTRNILAGVNPANDLSRVVSEASRAVDASSSVKNALAGLAATSGIEVRMKELLKVTGENSPLGRIAQDIAEQQRSIDDWNSKTAGIPNYAPPPIHMPKPRNPMAETNTRLERIERQFEHILDVANRGEQNSVKLQATGAEFLQLFVKAANDTNQSGSKAIRVGWLALGIAVLTALAQIAAPVFMPDYEAAELQQELVDLREEVAGLRSEQATMSERMIEALSAGDQATAAAVGDAVEEALAVKPVSEDAE
jgi:hypothetical protein